MRDNYTKKLSHAVESAARHEEWRVEYMTLLMRDQEMKEEGRQEGRQEVQLLNAWLAERGRVNDIIRASVDMEYQQQLLEEFNRCHTTAL